MPTAVPTPIKMYCSGLDLVSPVDMMPDGAFPVLTDCRVVQEGRIEGRPGYVSVSPTLNPTQIHSIRRLNDESRIYSSAGFTYCVGVGSSLRAGQLSSLASVATGFSGQPLSLIPFRPENSPSSWMYVYDADKQIKVRSDNTIRGVGTTPPKTAPFITYGAPATAIVTDADVAADWVEKGATTALADADRPASSNPTIASILYDSGNTGWCIISPGLNGVSFWAGERMQVLIDEGGPDEELVVVREIHPAITDTTIQAVLYDSGTTGWCSVALTNSPPYIARNSLFFCNGEAIKVQAVIRSTDGTSYTIRCRTTTAFAPGMSVVGRVSWYVYCTKTHSPGEPIDAKYVAATQPAKGTGSAAFLYSRVGTVDTNSGTITWVSGDKFATWRPGTTITINSVDYTIATIVDDETLTITGNAGSQSNVAYTVGALDASRASGRPISIADDYMHVSVFLSAPTKVSELNLYIDVDAGTTTVGVGGNAFTRNYWKWSFTQEQLNAFGPGSASIGSWVEIVVPISSGVRFGGDLTRSFDTIKAMQIELVSSAACDYGVDSWYFFGTYGPTVQPNSPVGIVYQSRYRDTETGSASLPGPITRYDLFPLREQVLVTPEATNESGVDSIDVYRLGGTVSSMVYVGTVDNVFASPRVFSDEQTDVVVSLNPGPDLTLLKPWPTQGLPISGTVDVVGSTVRWVSGDKFDVNMVANSVILINNNAYQVYGNPASSIQLYINVSAGVLSGATYEISSPIITGQSLPYVFGPLEGPFNPVVFGIGDPLNPGLLYYSNSANLDAASDANTLEITPPSEPLLTGETWNGLVFVMSKDNVFVVRYSYLQTQQDVTNNTTFQQNRIPSPSGGWTRRTCVRGPDGVYFLGRDGIYRATETGAVNITDAKLYPLFPHNGVLASQVNGYYPVDMTATEYMRLSVCDQDLFFDYIDTEGTPMTLRLEIPKQRWFMHKYGNGMRYHYLVEGSINSPASTEILMLPIDLGSVVRVFGDIDGSVNLSPVFVTPSFNNGDDRMQKLYTDMTFDTDCAVAGAGGVGITLLYNNQTVTGPGFGVTPSTTRTQQIKNVASLSSLSSWRDVSFRVTWSGGPSAARIYEFIFYAYPQPYLSTKVVTQFIDLNSSDWKHHRRLFPGLISNSELTFTIRAVDGRTFVVKIPSTGGQFNIVPQMLPQNIKAIAFAYELDGKGENFALFPDSFTLETKYWTQPSYVDLAVFKS